MSKTNNEQELEPILNESISRYTGKHVPFIGATWDIVLNEVYPIIQNNLPSIFFRNPKAFLKPKNKFYIAKQRDPITGQMVETQMDSEKSASTQEAILNYSLSEMKYKQEVRKSLLDALLFPYAVLWHGYKGNFGMTEEQAMYIKNERVFVKRINPMMFVYDPNVMINEIEEARWVARAIDVPYQDIIEDDKLDVDKKLLKGFQGYGQKVGTKEQLKRINSGEVSRERQGTDIVKTSLLSFTSDRFKNSNSSKFVRVYEVFLRPTKKEAREGSNGWILLLTEEQKKPLRISEWKIKAEGFPAKILEFNPLNDNSFGIADVDTYKTIADQKNVIVNLQIRNAQENTKNWVGISQGGMENEEDIVKIKRGENTVILYKGDINPRDRMFVASPGGQASSELYLIDQRIQRNLEDKSGVTDLKRGFLQSGEESAASVKIRAAGGGARPAYRQDIMADFLKDSFHYINQLNKQFVPYKEAVRIMGTLDLQWSENPTKEELQADTDVDIDAISMLPENPETELQELNSTLAMAINALNSPVIVQKLQQEGKTINLSPLIEKILIRQRINDPEIFRGIKPEESQGFVSVQQIREAKANVDSALKGTPVQFPPKPEDDHVAKLEVYTAISDLLKQAGQISDVLEQLIMLQTQLLQAVQEKEGQANQPIKLAKGGVFEV
jgi:hypothetical protein